MVKVTIMRYQLKLKKERTRRREDEVGKSRVVFYNRTIIVDYANIKALGHASSALSGRCEVCNLDRGNEKTRSTTVTLRRHLGRGGLCAWQHMFAVHSYGDGT